MKIDFLFDHNRKDEAACERFGVRDGQFFAVYKRKNLFWVLDGNVIGYGDLRMEDMERIQSALSEGEVFEGFNEHHGSASQQCENPQVRITSGELVWDVPRQR